MRVVGWIIAGVWAAFWAYWLISAFSVKRGRTRWGRWTRSRVVIVIIILALSRLGLLRHHASASGLPLASAGLVVVLAGLAFAVWARVHIGRNWGMPMTEKGDPELVTTGPYSRVRHPIYTGIIAGMIGTALAISVWYLIIAAVLGAYFVYSALNEERYMTTQFPDVYPGYKRSTKMLVPYVFLRDGYPGGLAPEAASEVHSAYVLAPFLLSIFSSWHGRVYGHLMRTWEHVID